MMHGNNTEFVARCSFCS